MALLTSGTTAQTSLEALKMTGAMTPANIALFAEAVKDDLDPAHPIWPGAFSQVGQLFVPNRGWLKVLPGDYVMVDATTGWPILVSANAIAHGPWVHS